MTELCGFLRALWWKHFIYINCCFLLFTFVFSLTLFLILFLHRLLSAAFSLIWYYFSCRFLLWKQLFIVFLLGRCLLLCNSLVALLIKKDIGDSLVSLVLEILLKIKTLRNGTQRPQGHGVSSCLLLKLARVHAAHNSLRGLHQTRTAKWFSLKGIVAALKHWMKLMFFIDQLGSSTHHMLWK
jgi:hypothetical protein